MQVPDDVIACGCDPPDAWKKLIVLFVGVQGQPPENISDLLHATKNNCQDLENGRAVLYLPTMGESTVQVFEVGRPNGDLIVCYIDASGIPLENTHQYMEDVKEANLALRENLPERCIFMWIPRLRRSEIEVLLL